jgi:hypothetical protein
MSASGFRPEALDRDRDALDVEQLHAPVGAGVMRRDDHRVVTRGLEGADKPAAKIGNVPVAIRREDDGSAWGHAQALSS